MDPKTSQWIADMFLTDGILNLEFGKLLAQGKGSVHGVDKSAAMIKSAQELCKDRPNCTFEGTYSPVPPSSSHPHSPLPTH
jgi:hypothetical protein